MVNGRECARVRDGCAWSCLGCFRAKQKCSGAVWESGEGGTGKPQEGHGWRAEGGSADGAGPSRIADDMEEVKELLRGLLEVQKESMEVQKELAEQMLNIQEKSTKDLIDVIDVAKYDRDPDRDLWDYEAWLEEMKRWKIDEELAELAKEENDFLEYVKWKAELKGQVGVAGDAATVAGPQVVEGKE